MIRSGRHVVIPGLMQVRTRAPASAIPPGPVYLLRDTFTAADGTALKTHTPDVGTSWVNGYPTSGDFTIASNAAVAIWGTRYITPALATYNFTASVVFSAAAGGSSECEGLLVCSDGSSSNYNSVYCIGYRPSGALWAIVSGASTVRASMAWPGSLAGRTISVTVTGNASSVTITATLDGGSTLTYTGAPFGTYIGLKGRYATEVFDNLAVI